MNLEKLSQISQIFFAISLIVVILYTFSSFLRPFVFAIIITIISVPYTIKKHKKHKIPLKGLKVLLSLFLILGIFSFISFFLHDNVEDLEEGDVQKSFSQQILNLKLNVFGKDIEVLKILDKTKIEEILEKSINIIFTTIKSFFSEIITIVLFLIFLIPSYKNFIKTAKNKLSKRQSNLFLNAIASIEMNLREYLLIKTKVSFLTGFLTGFTLFIFGVDLAILFGFLTFILNYIPNIGSFFAVGIVLVYELFFSNLGVIFWIFLAIILSLIQFVIGNVIEPKLAGDKLDISPILILLSLFFWGYIWGLWGMFFSVPLTLFVKAILEGFGILEILRKTFN